MTYVRSPSLHGNAEILGWPLNSFGPERYVIFSYFFRGAHSPHPEPMDEWEKYTVFAIMFYATANVFCSTSPLLRHFLAHF